MTTKVVDNQILQTRFYAATPERIWEAWTRPELIDQWWGPDGFANETERMDVRPGGEWVYLMRHADYGEFPNRIRYLEVEPAARLLYWHDAGPGSEADAFQVEVLFTPVEGGTELSMRSTFPSVEACRIVIEQYGALEGGQQTLARLAPMVEG